MGETFYFPSYTQVRFFAFIILLQKNQYFFKLKSLKLIKMIKIENVSSFLYMILDFFRFYYIIKQASAQI